MAEFKCEIPGCGAQPSKGDTVYRTSPKGEPWRGRCKPHLDARWPVAPEVQQLVNDLENPNAT